MALRDAPAITMTLHQLQRLVAGYVDMEDCQDLNAVAARIFQQAELHTESGCQECAETMWALARFRTDLTPAPRHP